MTRPSRQHRLKKAAVSLAVLGAALAPAHAREVFRLLEAHGDAAQCRVEIIEQASESIDLEYFIIETDRVALALLAELRAAARRGVTVRLLLDAGYNRLDRRVQGHLLAEGIEIREYHPFHIGRLGWITRRLHDKLLLADDRRLITGGRNISEPYFGLSDHTYNDRDVYVEGTAANAAGDYFEVLWHGGEVRRTKLGMFDPSELSRRCGSGREGWLCQRRRERIASGLRWAKELLDQHRGGLTALGLVRPGATVCAAGPRPPAEVRLLTDPRGRKGHENGIARELRELLEGARESVIIESPYLVPSRAFRRSLRAALERGVRVRILTNSLGTTDNLWPQAGYVGWKKKLVRWGVELWEVHGREPPHDTLHAKSAVIDDRISIVGSFNLDPRSEKLNTEMAAVADDPEIAAQLRASMDRGLEVAWRIDERGYPEGEDRRFPGIGWWKRLRLRLLRLIAPLIKRQL